MREPQLLLEPGAKLLMIGDSVTDCGRARPVGEGGGLGDGYVRNIASLLGACYPGQRIRVLNTGVSGNTVRDLKGRWQSDVLDLKPDWLSVMIGINDVWRHFDSPLDPEAAVPLDAYEQTLDELLSRTKPQLKGMVLMTPFYIEDNPADAMRARMDEYGQAVQRIADKHGAVPVDTQAAFLSALKHNHSSALAWDRVHPNQVGHMILARAWLQAVGFRFDHEAEG